MTLTFEFSSEAHTVSRGKIYETEEKKYFYKSFFNVADAFIKKFSPQKKRKLAKAYSTAISDKFKL